jgi:putative copper resistance protein D
MHEGLILCRFVHFGAVLLLLGIDVFRHVLFRHDLGPFEASGLARRVDRCLQVLALVALLSAVLWLMLTAGSMAGSWRDALDVDTLALVLGNTFFGHVWIVHLGLSLLAVVAVFRRPNASGWQTAVLALLLFTLAPVGHGAMFDGIRGQLLILNQIVHLSGVSLWLGGLIMLALLMKVPRELDLRRVLLRFSGIGYVLVASIVLTGLINVRALSGGFWPEPAFSGFGRVLAIKAGLVLAMLLLAAINRKLVQAEVLNVPVLRVSVFIEGALGAGALAAVSLLGTLPPMLAG